MQTITALIFILWSAGIDVSVVEPGYPPNAASGGTVVATLDIADGAVEQVGICLGESPFVEPTLAALQKWRFSGDEIDPAALVIVNFRGPNLYPTGSPRHNLALTETHPMLPIPTLIVEPGYPPNSIGEGGVAFQLDVTDSGSVSRIKELKAAGGLTSAAFDAVKQWQFKPALNAEGKAVPSKAYAVCVFRRPVLGR